MNLNCSWVGHNLQDVLVVKAEQLGFEGNGVEVEVVVLDYEPTVPVLN